MFIFVELFYVIVAIFSADCLSTREKEGIISAPHCDKYSSEDSGPGPGRVLYVLPNFVCIKAIYSRFYGDCENLLYACVNKYILQQTTNMLISSAKVLQRCQVV